MILQRPPDAWLLYVLAHGAGAGMRHPFMQSLADELYSLGIASLRYDFPYMEAGARRIDPAPVLHARVREAVAAGLASGLPLIAGGKSMGGRMTSQAQALEALPGVLGLAFVGFPLHPAGKPSVTRADHLRDVHIPTLFLQGTCDDLCSLDLLKPVLPPLSTLHLEDGADHSFHVLKRSGRTDPQVLTSLAHAIAAWSRQLLAPQ